MTGTYAVDIADDTFVVADPAEVARLVADPAAWRHWWPDLEPTVTRDRGVKGVQWAVRGGLVGSMEIWLEPVLDGVVVHWYVRAELPPGGDGPRAADRERDRRVDSWKRDVHALKDRLETGRAPGEPRVPGPDPRAAAKAGVKEPGKPADST